MRACGEVEHLGGWSYRKTAYLKKSGRRKAKRDGGEERGKGREGDRDREAEGCNGEVGRREGREGESVKVLGPG